MYTREITPTWFMAIGSRRNGRRVVLFAYSEEEIIAKKQLFLAGEFGSRIC